MSSTLPQSELAFDQTAKQVNLAYLYDHGPAF
jgi:hypothetical protein